MCVFLISLGGNVAHGEVKNRVPVTKERTRQKLNYFKNMMTKGVAVQRIARGQSEAAKAALRAIMKLYSGAFAAFAAGDFVSANHQMNEAIRRISKASRTLDYKKSHAALLKKNFTERRASVEALLKAYDRVSKEKKQGNKSLVQSRQIKGYIDKADAFISNGKVDSGTKELEKAYTLVSALTAQLRQGETLVRVLHFETPKDEYLYELDRNDSLISVLQMVVEEKKPNPAYRAKIKELKIKAHDIRKKAAMLAKEGAYHDAMLAVEDSTRNLIRAVRMAGLFIPG